MEILRGVMLAIVPRASLRAKFQLMYDYNVHSFI